MNVRSILGVFVLLAWMMPVGVAAQSVTQLFEKKSYESVAEYLTSIDSLEADEQAMVAYALLRLERFFLAEKAFIVAESSGQNSARFFHQFAQMYLVRDDYRKALNKLNRARQLAPEDLSIMHDKAAALMAIEEWQEASFLLRKMLKKRPDHAQYIALLGTCYLEKEEPLKALKLYDTYLPNVGSTVYDRDILWDCARIARYRLGDLPRAEEYLLQLTKLFPDYWEGQQELVQLYNMRKKFFSAEAILKQAAYAFEKRELPDAWMKSGYWMTDVIRLEFHRIHVYASLFDDDDHPSFKLFILDPKAQHVMGKMEIWKTSNDSYELRMETTLKKEQTQCTNVDDYGRLRSCIRRFAEELDAGYRANE